MLKRAMILLLVLAGVLLSQSGKPQFEIATSPYLNVTLTDTETKTIYFLFPDAGGSWYLSETLPTKFYSGTVRRPLSWWTSGDVYLFMEPNTSTGMSAAETDSLSCSILPIVWDEYDQEFATVDVDSTYLVFDTAGTYTAASADWLDWTTGQEYGCLLTGKLLPVAGFSVTMAQKNSTSGAGIYTLQLSLTRQVR